MAQLGLLVGERPGTTKSHDLHRKGLRKQNLPWKTSRFREFRAYGFKVLGFRVLRF